MTSTLITVEMLYHPRTMSINWSSTRWWWYVIYERETINIQHITYWSLIICIMYKYTSNGIHTFKLSAVSIQMCQTDKLQLTLTLTDMQPDIHPAHTHCQVSYVYSFLKTTPDIRRREAPIENSLISFSLSRSISYSRMNSKINRKYFNNTTKNKIAINLKCSAL